MEKKSEMTAFDIRFVINELKENLINSVFRKIYHYENKEFLFQVFNPGKGDIWFYVDRNKIFITEYKREVPKEPSSFCMFLRKYLLGQRITDVKQVGFDRIVEIYTKGNVLIFELLKPGNVILTDSLRNVIMPLEIQKYKDREIKPKNPYKYPPRPTNPFELDFAYFKRYANASDKKIIVFLAGMGFGAVYAKEICKRAGIDENQAANALDNDSLLKLYETISLLAQEKPRPCIYNDVFVSPISLRIFEEEPRYFETFSKALDEFFLKQYEERVVEEQEKIIEKEKEKVERIIEQQKKAEEKWKKATEESKEIAETIYNYYGTVEAVISAIKKAREQGMSWSELKERIEKEESPEADAIKEIREHEGIVVLTLGGRDIEIDFRKSVEENAEMYYMDMKWAKKKLSGVEKAKEEVVEKVKEIKEVVEKPVVKKKPVKRRKKWYEKFHWFISSDGFLVIGGKDAKQNEMIFSKYIEPNDLVFHADVHGASLVVAKAGDKEEISDETKKEASEFAAAHCKAWSNNLSDVDVYCVKPDQISKSAPSGQYLPKGSFYITGPREWFHNVELKISIGVKIEEYKGEEIARVLYGPVMAMRKNCDYFITIKPGFKKASELVNEIKNKLLIKAIPEHKDIIKEIPPDEFQKAIPYGTGEIVEYG